MLDPRNLVAKRLLVALRREVVKLREQNTDAYHAALMEKAADVIEKLLLYKFN